MKKWTFKVALMVFTLATLAACSDKDKSTVAAPTPPGVDGNGICIPDQTGQCPGMSPFVGRGTWSGTLIVNQQTNHLYRAFLNEHGVCNSFWCNRLLTEYVSLSVRMQPSQARVTITPYLSTGWGRDRISQDGGIFSTNGGTGFQIVMRDERYYIQGPGQPVQPQIYPQPIAPPQNGVIQLTGSFTSAMGNAINVSLYYRGNLIATGQLLGYRYY